MERAVVSAIHCIHNGDSLQLKRQLIEAIEDLDWLHCQSQWLCAWNHELTEILGKHNIEIPLLSISSFVDTPTL